ncbi:hypothetical protein TR74_01370, partial [Carbonactinospora thermoautotrophica]
MTDRGLAGEVVCDTWDSTAHREEFPDWACTAGAARLPRNPTAALEGGTEYLRDLAARGVPVSPTVVRAGHRRGRPFAELAVKPAVSAGARPALRPGRSARPG